MKIIKETVTIFNIVIGLNCETFAQFDVSFSDLYIFPHHSPNTPLPSSFLSDLDELQNWS